MTGLVCLFFQNSVTHSSAELQYYKLNLQKNGITTNLQ
jgi:hypothetical protein